MECVEVDYRWSSGSESLGVDHCWTVFVIGAVHFDKVWHFLIAVVDVYDGLAIVDKLVWRTFIKYNNLHCLRI